jgi:hypothetical protein
MIDYNDNEGHGPHCHCNEGHIYPRKISIRTINNINIYENK